MDSPKYPMTSAVNAYTAAFGQTVPAGLAKLACGIPGAWDRLQRDLQDSVKSGTPLPDWADYAKQLQTPSEETSTAQ